MDQYARLPFKVEAVQVTPENMEELKNLIGSEAKKATGSGPLGHAVKKKEDGTPYIVLNKKVIPGGFRAYPGYWVTRMAGPKGELNLRCYPEMVFADQFGPMVPELEPYLVKHTNVDLPPAETEESFAVPEAMADDVVSEGEWVEIPATPIEAEPQADDAEWVPADPLDTLEATDADPV